jgi:hypothetical protein
MDVSDQILTSVETLESLYFLLKSLTAHEARLSMIRAEYSRLAAYGQQALLRELLAEIDSIRTQSGAVADNDSYRELFRAARKHVGMAYLSKLFIDSKLFSNYERVFPRWPNVKFHALVVFDGKRIEDLKNILEIESLLFGDVQVLLARAREEHKGIDDFRKRSPEDQARLESYLRTAMTAIFHFLEAYLNGLAYDCFQTHHDQLSPDDHDLLSERTGVDQRTKFVAFSKKVFAYPAIVAKMDGIKLDLAGSKFAHQLADDRKIVRDALTHPSYYIDPKSGLQDKLLYLTGVNLALVEQVFAAAKEYVGFVEQSLGRDPKLSTPWLFN